MTSSKPGVLGNQLEQIDKNGDANGSYTLLSFQSEMDRSMRKVATFIPRPDCATSKDSNVKKLCVHVSSREWSGIIPRILISFLVSGSEIPAWHEH